VKEIKQFMGYRWKIDGCFLRWEVLTAQAADSLDVFEFQHPIIDMRQEGGRLIVETEYGKYCVNMGYYEQNIYPMVTLMEKF
jgi:hypothetical protein